jgi:hypothetical protein
MLASPRALICRACAPMATAAAFTALVCHLIPRPTVFPTETSAYKRGTSTTCLVPSPSICPLVSRATTHPLFPQLPHHRRLISPALTPRKQVLENPPGEAQLMDIFALAAVHRSAAAPCHAAVGFAPFGELLHRLDPDPDLELWHNPLTLPHLQVSPVAPRDSPAGRRCRATMDCR